MSQPAHDDGDFYATNMPVGEILRRAREHYGQSLSDIERALRIRACQLEAIETGHIEALPGRVYAIGFVRSYSEYLGLDGAHMVHLFKEQAGRVANDPELHFPAAAPDTKLPPSWLLVASLAAVVFLVIGWWALSSSPEQQALVTEVPSVEETIGETQVVYGPPAPAEIALATEKSPESENPVVAPVVVEPEQTIIINVTENSWVEIHDEEGSILVSRVLKAGDRFYVPDRPGLLMSLGNAGGIELEVNGRKLGALGERGDVQRRIDLGVESLIQRFGLAETAE